MNNRIFEDEAAELLTKAYLPELMYEADSFRFKLHGAKTYFTNSLNLNPTNICENKCKLCAYWKDLDSEDAFHLDLNSAEEKLINAKKLGITEIHIVGGVTELCDLDYYEELFVRIEKNFPGLPIKALTAVEIDALSKRSGKTVEEVLVRLKERGLRVIPGGGAEIFSERVRKLICSNKISGKEWLSIHETAHKLGIFSNATMLFGHVEDIDEIVEHMSRVRELQDRTHGFQAFIPLPFHPHGTKLNIEIGPTGTEILRLTAVSRLFMDNIPHIRALSNYLDRKLLQVLMRSGVDDIGGTSFDERIALSAGASNQRRFSSLDEMKRFIEQLGLESRYVNSLYEPIWDEKVSSDFSEKSKAPVKFKFKNDIYESVRRKILDGKRISHYELIDLWNSTSFQKLGSLANIVRKQKNCPDRATFVIDRNISLTNICETGCSFCAFHVAPGAENGFLLSEDEVLEKIKNAENNGATQVLIQGGLNSDLSLSFFETLFRRIKSETRIWNHSLSPTEIVFLAKKEGITIEETLRRLKDAGLDSLPGGGAEILVDDVRKKISPKKISTAEWLSVMRAVHGLGMKSTATMVYGLGETIDDRVEHLDRLRELQDETGGFTAFIPWSFQSARTRLSREQETGVDYLKMVSLSRIALDNFEHVQAGWVTESPDLAQTALLYGADDFGGILMEEKVVRETGISYELDLGKLITLIKRTGMKPIQRTTLYEFVKEW
ncbi:TPA: dehypoxanthine futalosine cyclase [bacterium]|nr:MAG: dehypoxanthine futalosine cyclase [Candidatus Hydrogenedentes bacterium CG07_land_8_20_14_0_80_42_17]HBW46344.1 dehypoxanthine futalosine cyclase [bacterium]